MEWALKAARNKQHRSAKTPPHLLPLLSKAFIHKRNFKPRTGSLESLRLHNHSRDGEAGNSLAQTGNTQSSNPTATHQTGRQQTGPAQRYCPWQKQAPWRGKATPCTGSSQTPNPVETPLCLASHPPRHQKRHFFHPKYCSGALAAFLSTTTL